MNKLISLPLLSSLIACGASTPPPNHAVASSAAARDVSFASYHTFAFGLAQPPRPGYEVTPRSLEVQRRLRALVKSAIEDRGLTETTDKPDMIVNLSTGSGSGYALRPVSYDSTLIPAERRGPVPAVGFIGIDIYEAASGVEVWQGSAFAEVDPVQIDDALLRRGVDHMLAGFGSSGAESVAKAP